MYGLLGLVREEDRFVVDHRKSIQEVFMNAIVALGGRRAKYAVHLSKHMVISSVQTDSLLAFLDLLQPLALGQSIEIYDRSPTTHVETGSIALI